MCGTLYIDKAEKLLLIDIHAANVLWIGNITISIFTIFETFLLISESLYACSSLCINDSISAHPFILVWFMPIIIGFVIPIRWNTLIAIDFVCRVVTLTSIGVFTPNISIDGILIIPCLVYITSVGMWAIYYVMLFKFMYKEVRLMLSVAIQRNLVVTMISSSIEKVYTQTTSFPQAPHLIQNYPFSASPSDVIADTSKTHDDDNILLFDELKKSRAIFAELYRDLNWFTFRFRTQTNDMRFKHFIISRFSLNYLIVGIAVPACMYVSISCFIFFYNPIPTPSLKYYQVWIYVCVLLYFQVVYILYYLKFNLFHFAIA